VWLYEYDADQNLLQVVDPYGAATSFERGPGGELVAEVDSDGRRTEYLHDDAGAQVAKRLPNGIVVPLPEGPNPPDPDAHRVPGMAIEWEYGDLWDLDFGLPDRFELQELPAPVRDALTTSESPLRGRVEQVHDEAGLLTREVLEDGRKRRFGYTHRGKIRRYRDFDGSDYKLETRSWDLPYRHTDPLGNVTQFDYSQTAELIEAIDPAGNRVHYTYDLEDRLVGIGRNASLHDRYEYDGSDNLVAKYDGEGRQLLALEYDAHDRLVRRELIGFDEHTFEYDDDGWVVRACTHEHEVRFGWDGWRRRVRDERDGRGVRHRFVGAHLASTTVLDHFRTEYHTLDDGTIVVVDPTGATHRLRRHGRGVFTRDLANGWSETAQYSPRGWCLAKVTYATDAPERARTRKYHYSGEGDLQRVIDTERGVTEHHHDAAHRLVGTTHPNGAQDTYRYTRSGSLLEKPGLKEATVGHLDQLRYADGHRFEYGTRQHVSTHTTPDGHRLEYKYDPRDQLVAVLWNGHPTGPPSTTPSVGGSRRTSPARSAATTGTATASPPRLGRTGASGSTSTRTHSRWSRCSSWTTRARTPTPPPASATTSSATSAAAPSVWSTTPARRSGKPTSNPTAPPTC
jgi:YD repeat-containing protein